MIVEFSVVLFFDLRCKVVPDVTEVWNLIFNDERNICRHAQTNLCWEWRGFRERVQILASEGQSDRLLHFNGHGFLFLVNRWCLSQLDVSWTRIASCWKSNPFFGTCDDNGFSELRQITADTSEFLRWHANDASVVSLGNAQMLLVQIHQFHFIVRDFLLVLWFEHECNSVCVVLSLDGNRVVVVGALQDLCHVSQVHSHREIAVTTVLVEAIRSEVQRNEGHVRIVHGLKLSKKIKSSMNFGARTKYHHQLLTWIPASEQSKVASVSKSLIESNTFLRVPLEINLASNIFQCVFVCCGIS